MAAQSDPDLNPQFRRRWSGPPLERKSPRMTAIIQGADFEITGWHTQNSEMARVLQWACRLDRLADAELSFGHHDAAERLSQQAAELREGTR